LTDVNEGKFIAVAGVPD